MAEYSRRAHGTKQINSDPIYISLPFLPDFIQVWDLSRWAHPLQVNVPYIMWNKFMTPGDGLQIIDIQTLIPSSTFQFIGASAFGGITPVINGQALSYGPPVSIQAISKASQPVVTCVNPHGLETGDVVVLNGLIQSAGQGMQQIAGIPFTITYQGTHLFSINWNTNQSNYTALSGSPSGAYFRKVLNPYLYSPGDLFISNITLGSSTTISTTTYHKMYVGQEVAFRVPARWGTYQLNSSARKGIPGSPLYAVVTSITDTQNVVVNIDSSQFNAFNSNQPFASYSGQSFAQMVAVGDTNMGGDPLNTYSTNLYPSPPTGLPLDTSSVNGPAIEGSFVNFSKYGFLLGDAFAVSPGDYIYWEATQHDISMGVPLPVL